jgi:hypothetical protein
MPFCPQCRFEYTAGVSRCPDCGAELVDSLPADEPAAQSDFAEVELCVVTGELHAKLLQNALASQGIRSRVQSPWPFDSPFSLTRLPSPIGSGFDAAIRVLVSRSDLARARVVYEDFERHGGAAADEFESPD